MYEAEYSFDSTQPNISKSNTHECRSYLGCALGKTIDRHNPRPHPRPPGRLYIIMILRQLNEYMRITFIELNEYLFFSTANIFNSRQESENLIDTMSDLLNHSTTLLKLLSLFVLSSISLSVKIICLLCIPLY